MHAVRKMEHGATADHMWCLAVRTCGRRPTATWRVLCRASLTSWRTPQFSPLSLPQLQLFAGSRTAGVPVSACCIACVCMTCLSVSVPILSQSAPVLVPIVRVESRTVPTQAAVWTVSRDCDKLCKRDAREGCTPHLYPLHGCNYALQPFLRWAAGMVSQRRHGSNLGPPRGGRL